MKDHNKSNRKSPTEVAELRESEEFHKAILDLAPYGIQEVDSSGKNIYVNPAYCKILGYTKNEVIGLYIWNFVDSEEEMKRLQSTVRIIHKDHPKPETYITKARTKSGKKIDVQVDWDYRRNKQGKVISTIAVLSDITERRKVEEALRFVVEGTSRTLAADFFPSLVKYLAAALDSRFAFISEFHEDMPDRLRLIAMCHGSEVVENFEYDIQGTPCEQVVGKRLACFPENVQDLFPDDLWLKKMHIESYIAIPLFTENGNPLGHLGVMHDEPMREGVFAERILRIFADRAGAELERKRVEEKLRGSREQLRNLAARLQTLPEEERIKIARELHDNLGQNLTVLKIDLSWLKQKLHKNRTSLLEKIDSMGKLIDVTIARLRKVTAELRPRILDELGLVAAIEWQSSEFQKRTGIKCKLTAQYVSLGKERSTAVFRIFQESLANVARHAHATIVNVSLQNEASSLVLTVKDNGRGIRDREISDRKSLGLLGMRERASILGGELNVCGTSKEGTTLKVQIPLDG